MDLFVFVSVHQPSNPIDVAARPGAVPHTLLQKDPRVSMGHLLNAVPTLVVLIAACFSVQITDPFRTSVRVSAHLVHFFFLLMIHLSGQATKSQPVKISAVPDQ